ncbi:MAG: flgI [Caulobacteraceae bacterium]|nr:flgI [Caulobacteraceae bacterium]
MGVRVSYGMPMPRSRLPLLGLAAVAALACGPSAEARSRIKDIVAFEGVRDNQLIGHGLVVGLNGTGDSLRNCPMTRQMLEAMMEHQGVNVRETQLNTKNVAYVEVTAKLPPFSAPGSTIDVSVSATCDGKSLLGGTLIVTALQGADGQTYAAAQGTVQTGSVSASGASGSTVTKGVPTAGRIPAGGIIERETGYRLTNLATPRLTLRNPDFTTAQRIVDAINTRYPGTAVSENPTTVTLRPPAQVDRLSFMTAIEALEVSPDNPAKVVIDEVAGVIVVGDAVRVSTVAIQQGNLTISVQEAPQVSQPNPLSRGGQTQVTPQSNVKVDEETGRQFVVLKDGASLATLVAGLNALGVTPRDMISILNALKAQGALQAEIEVM